MISFPPAKFSHVWESFTVPSQSLSQKSDRATSSIIFIDSTVADKNCLIAGIKLETEVFILHPEADGVEQISKILRDRSEVTSIHIVCHGQPGNLQLGNINLSLDNILAYHKSLQNWSKKITQNRLFPTEILIYGCSVAADLTGKAFINKLSELTGANIAAATEALGKGKSWNLDFSVGEITTPIIFAEAAIASYNHTLAAPILAINDGFSLERGVNFTITNSILKITDAESTNDQIVYTLTALPLNGTVQLDGEAITLGETFTQDDINNNKLSYLHNGSLTNSDSFSFSATDSSGISNIKRISISANNGLGNDRSFNPDISSNGRYVTFSSDANNLTNGDTNNEPDIYLRDTVNGTTTLISVTNSNVASGISWDSSISEDGQNIAFVSAANNIIPQDNNTIPDIFLRNSLNNKTTLISTGLGGTTASSFSFSPVVAGNGRYVIFGSNANNLVAGDNNNQIDIFLRDTLNNTTKIVSLAADNNQGNNASFSPAISANGQYAAFLSKANNLVPGDNNNEQDIFFRDILNSVTSLVSVATGNTTPGNAAARAFSMSSDGRYIVFGSESSNLVPGDNNGQQDIFLRDTSNSTTRLISISTGGTLGNNASENPSISNDGRYIVFKSAANNLVAGDNNNQADIFLRDTLSSTTTLLPLGSSNATGAPLSFSISGDGKYVVFTNSSIDNDDIFLYEIGGSTVPTPSSTINGSVPVTINSVTNQDGTVNEGESLTITSNLLKTASQSAVTYTLLSLPNNGNLKLNGNELNLGGNFTQDDVNNNRLSYTHDGSETINDSFTFSASDGTGNPTTVKVSQPGSYSYSPSISGSGEQVAFSSFSYNVENGYFNGVSVNNLDSSNIVNFSSAYGNPNLSLDGSQVAFSAYNGNFGNFIPQIFLGDVNSGNRVNVSVNAAGNLANNWSWGNSVSADGNFVAFSSYAGNLVDGDTNNNYDVFVRDIKGEKVERVSVNSEEEEANSWSFLPSISANGRYVAFASFASNLVPGDTNNSNDIFIRDREEGKTTRIPAPGNLWCYAPSISADGRYTAFSAYGFNGNQLYIYDQETKQSTPIPGTNNAWGSSISPDGRYVAYTAYNPQPSGYYYTQNVFVYDRQTGKTTQRDTGVGSGFGSSYSPSISVGGESVAFNRTSWGQNQGYFSYQSDIFVNDKGNLKNTFNINVNPVNDPPIVSKQIPKKTAVNNTAFNFQLPEKTFTDPDIGDSLTYSATTPSWLNFNSTTGIFSGTPTQTGIFSVEIQAKDNTGATVNTTFPLKVVETNAPPVAGSIANQTATEDQKFSFKVLDGIFTDDNDLPEDLVYKASLANGSSLPAWLKFDPINRTFEGTPRNKDVGNLSVKLQAEDTGGAASNSLFNLTVQNVNDPPILNTPIRQQRRNLINSNTQLILDSDTFVDPDIGDTLTYSATQYNGSPLPSFLKFNPTTRAFSTSGSQSGFVSVKVTATDTSNANASDSFALSVICGGIVIDGYISGATVFFDKNKNSILDADEPSTTTNSDGTYALDISVEDIDTNNNGQVDPQEGRIVVTGGVDTATNLPLATPLTATPDATTVTLLTTLVTDLVDGGLTSDEAQDRVKSALRLESNIDLLAVDPIDTSNRNQPGGTDVLSAMVKVQNVITQTAALIGGIATSSNVSIVNSVVKAVNSSMQNAGFLDLSAAGQLQTIIVDAATNLKQQEPNFDLARIQAIVADVALVMAAANQATDQTLASTPPNNVDKQIAGVQKVALGKTSNDLKAVAAGTKTIEELLAENMGPALNRQIQLAQNNFGFFNIPSSDSLPNPTSSGSVGFLAIPVVKGDIELISNSTRLEKGSDENDTMIGTENDDIFLGRSGNDSLQGLGGNDWLHGGRDRDTVEGGFGDDTMYGGKNEDSLLGNDGRDLIFGDLGNDSIFGGDRDDFLFGNRGEDSLEGGAGNDIIYGGQGADSILGGDGDDILFGDRGNDSLTGGLGRDYFILTNQGTDVITDFSKGQDFLGLSSQITFESLDFVQDNRNALIKLRSSGEVLASLIGVDANSLVASDFVSLG
ncbi:hypothetical protein BCD67_08345 [Oscillatoriales cyanobacterium USR001]|nr:hypothetical protein BCD67_08345 [Oscillatoriales cyanobacterium USR001]